MKPYFSLLSAIAAGLLLAACSKSTSNPVSTPTLTEAQKQVIVATYTTISAVADSLLATSDPSAALTSYAPTARAAAGVEDAWTTKGGFFVKFSSAGTVAWFIKSSVVVPPYGILDPLPGGSRRATGKGASTLGLVGNKKACLINQQFGDESRQYCRDVVDHLNTAFGDNGYTVTLKNGPDANLSFLGSGLSTYGAIFYISHGAYDGTRTWVCSGEEATAIPPLSPMNTLIALHPLDWLMNRVSIGKVTETVGGHTVLKALYMFSEGYINNQYSAGSFPSSLVYLVACQGLKASGMSDAFASKGASAVIGWDETNCLGQSTGKLLFDELLCGENVSEAFADLPAEAKLDPCEVTPGASLVYRGGGSATTRLVPAETGHNPLAIDSPATGISTSRIVRLLAHSSDGSLKNGFLEVNGVTGSLNITSGSIDHRFVIDSGRNTIHIHAFGQDVSSNPLCFDTTLVLNGQFGQLDLFTELLWNDDFSDVDFHLLPPGASAADLWTTNDCYYSNKAPSWGAYLDVDDVNGRGPEHITLPTAQTPGTYTLYIHYYAAHGAASTDAFVSVSVRNAPMVRFAPLGMSDSRPTNGNGHGDLWDVCTVDFPSGTITPVLSHVNLGIRVPPAKLASQ